MISYNLAPIPIWPLRDNLGEPLANGYMLAYRDLVRGDFKPVYQDPAGMHVYLQPIVFNAAGFEGPFYWASDENYFLEIYDAFGNLVKTVSAYNAPNNGGSGPITVVSSNKNYIPDSQFRFMLGNYSPVPLFLQTGSANWFFTKNNTTAIDSLTVNDFVLGSTVPPYNPPQFMRYTCSVPGTGETFKFYYSKFQSVYSFQNTEVTLAFWAKAQIPGTVLRAVVYQNFGTGNAVSPEVINYPVNFSLTTNWAQYSITFTVPSVTGKTIGNQLDDFLGIGIGFPLDSICQIDFTNFQLNSGNTLEPFEYLSATNQTPLQVPFFSSDDFNFYSKFLSIDQTGKLNWNSTLNTGYFISGNGPLVSLGQTFAPLPISPTSDIPGWISGAGVFSPNQPCTVWITAYYEIVSGTGNIEAQIVILVNGSNFVSSQSIFIQNSGSGEITLPAVVPMNGVNDSIQIVGRFSGSGDAGAQLIFLGIKTL